jgi:hypothetical protein
MASQAEYRFKVAHLGNEYSGYLGRREKSTTERSKIYCRMPFNIVGLFTKLL